MLIPTREPITMPAMAPPDNGEGDLESNGTGEAPEVEVEVVCDEVVLAVAIEDAKKVKVVKKVGSAESQSGSESLIWLSKNLKT